MATPKCPHCGGISIGMTTVSPAGAAYKANVIHCLSCGAPFGALDYYDSGVMLRQIQQKLNDLEKKIQRLGG